MNNKNGVISSNSTSNSTSTFTRRSKRLKTHKSFNIHMSLEVINEFEEKNKNNVLNFDKNENNTTTYNIGNAGNTKNNSSIYESKQFSNKSINDKFKKSNIKKGKITNEELKHVRFGVNDDNIRQKPVMKKTKSNYLFKAPDINDINTLLNKSHNVKPPEIKGRLITDFPKYERTKIKDKSSFKKQDSKEIDDDWNPKEFSFNKKKTADFNNRRNESKNNQNNKLRELNSQFTSFSYIKSTQSTSVAGKGENG